MHDDNTGRIYRFIADGHCDALSKLLDTGGNLYENPKLQVDLKRLLSAGVRLQVFAIFVKPIHHPHHSVPETLRLIDLFYRECAAHPQLRLVKSGSDLDHVLGDSQTVGALLSIEGGESLGYDLSALRIYKRLGVRLVTLTWNHRNMLADGASEEDTGGGLTAFGRQVVAELQRLQMAIDVSHLSRSGFWSLVEVADAPLIASHSNCRALCDHPRNLDDDQIRAIASRGGLICVNFVPSHLKASGRATLEDVRRHIDHICEVVGPQYVGLGSDFDGIDSTPVGLSDAGKLPALAVHLFKGGYSQEQVQGFMGGNLVRYLRQVLVN